MSAATREVLAVVPDNVPDELKARPQWVVWRLEERQSGPTKVLYSPRGGKAKSTDLMTWGTFEEAYEAYGSGRYSGVGFVFCSADPYVGVDLDSCVDAQTGELELWAAEIVAELDSYAELSPSGTGVHVIARGALPGGRRRKGRVEMYDQGRFFTVTGHVLGDRR